MTGELQKINSLLPFPLQWTPTCPQFATYAPQN